MMKSLVNEITNTFKSIDTTRINTYWDTTREFLQKAGLPELQGSEKQVAWAEKIRMTCLVNTITDLCLAEKNGNYGRKEIKEHTEEAINYVRELATNKIETFVLKNVSAKWWIENRSLLESPTPVGYMGEKTDTTIKLNLHNWAQLKEKELNRRDVAKETGETQVVLKKDCYTVKVTPTGEIELENTSGNPRVNPILTEGGVILKLK